MGGKSFSFDVWFSLLPASCDEHFGGVIYGIQSSSRESCERPHYYQQYVMQRQDVYLNGINVQSKTQNEVGRVPGNVRLIRCTRITEAACLQQMN
ncbi:hypothetical protein JG687_00019076 [Phytophthora cactorum]|uniref:Uncharacterized protein n=1 Tax=Phytophthora cactorum TaxID=29920 RepID=A0A8T1TM62_9STRA|nr:hypothetical protein JG687_00019076 [Phytophthora cactorum]